MLYKTHPTDEVGTPLKRGIANGRLLSRSKLSPRGKNKIFGKGIFVKAQAQGSKEFFTVDFGRDVGQKILLADIANLVRV